MSDHADTIRRALPAKWDGREQTERQAKITAKASAAHAALDSLVAERQQAIDDGERGWRRAEWLENKLEVEKSRCEQAIDALRETEEWAYEQGFNVLAEELRAALVSLGETEAHLQANTEIEYLQRWGSDLGEKPTP